MDVTREPGIDADGIEPDSDFAAVPEPDLAHRTFTALDTEVGTLARRRDAIDYRLLSLIAELDRRDL